jgi:hypothetical protein
VTGGADACPEYFLKNAYTQGTYVDCAGNSLEDLRKNLALKHASRHHGDNSPAKDNGCHGACVLAMVLGGVVLVGAVMYQLCKSAFTPFRV